MVTNTRKKTSLSLPECGKWAMKHLLGYFNLRGKISHDYSGIYQRCQKGAEPVFSHLTWCISFLLDMHSPVRTSGLKPSTLKQLGQSVVQPPTAEERKVVLQMQIIFLDSFGRRVLSVILVWFFCVVFFPRWVIWPEWQIEQKCSSLRMMRSVTGCFYYMAG